MNTYFEREQRVIFADIMTLNDGIFTEGNEYVVINFDSHTERVLLIDDMDQTLWVNGEAFIAADKY